MLRIAAILTILLSAFPAQATEAGWALLRQGGQVVLLSHAIAPGSGDPANFDIGNCRTQRNLSEQGRLQARRLGALIAARAAPVERVLASRYCRTLDTARQAFGERMPEPFPALDPFPAEESAYKTQAAEIMQVIRDYTGSGNLVLVTHPANIAKLTGTTPREGEAVIVFPTEDGLSVGGRIIFR